MMGGTPHQSPARDKKLMARAQRVHHDSPRSLIVISAGEEEDAISPAVLPQVASTDIIPRLVSPPSTNLPTTNPPSIAALLDTVPSTAPPTATPPFTSHHIEPAQSTKIPRVAILGAGPAGLAAGQALKKKGIHAVIYEARARPGGRVLSVALGGDTPTDSNFEKLAYHGSDLQHKDKNAVIVDIGASVMHGCGDRMQFVLRRAIAAKIRAPLCAGGIVYESPEAAQWFRNGKRIPTVEIVRMNSIFNQASKRMGEIAHRKNDRQLDMRTVWEEALSEFERAWRPLEKSEKVMLEKICQRAHGYCAPIEDMSANQASSEKAGKTKLKIDMKAIRVDASYYDKMFSSKVETPIASMKGGTGDRIVLDGYTPFLIDSMKQGLDIRLSSIVKKVSVLNDQPKKTMGTFNSKDNGPWRTNYDSNALAPGKATSLSVDTTESPADSRVIIQTADGAQEEFDHAIVALPLGVLQSENPTSAVQFEPPLPALKRDAIRSMGMGVHNKIILIFRPQDVFWPKNVAQLNCFDLRFQFFNLHAYGKPGTLLVHVFGESKFHREYSKMSDRDIAMEAVRVLQKDFYSSIRSNTRAHSESKKKKVAALVPRTEPSRRSPRNAVQPVPLKLRIKSPFLDGTDMSLQVSERPKKKLKATDSSYTLRKRHSPRKRQRTNSFDSYFELVVRNQTQEAAPPTRRSARLHKKSRILLKLPLKPSTRNLKKIEEVALEDSNGHNGMPLNKKQKIKLGKTEEVVIDGNNIDSQAAPRVEESFLDGGSLAAGDATMPPVGNTEKVFEEIIEEGNANTIEDEGTRAPEPIHYHVTRWHQDPFSLGSYSYLPTGADFKILERMRLPEKMETTKNRLFFAGEHLSDLGWQCVHGAHETGVMAANEVLIAAGLRDENAKFEELDDFPPPKEERPLSEVDIETMLNFCENFMYSPGQLYDVLDEIIHLFERSRGEATGNSDSKKRRQLWKTLNEIASGKKTSNKKNAELHKKRKIAGDFLRQRYCTAKIEAARHQAYGKSHLKRTKTSRPIMTKPNEYENILEELLNKKQGKKGIKQRFSKAVYERTGAILSTEAVSEYLCEKLEIRGEDRAPTGQESKEMKQLKNKSLKSLNYPSVAEFENWAAQGKIKKSKGLSSKAKNGKNRKPLHPVNNKVIPKIEEETIDDNTRVRTRSRSKI